MWQKHSLSCYDSLVLLEIYSNILIKMWKCLHRTRISFFGIESRRKQFWLGNRVHALQGTAARARGLAPNLYFARVFWEQILNNSVWKRHTYLCFTPLPYEQARGIAIKNEYLDARVLFHFKILPFICISLESSENKSLITRFEKDIPTSVSRPFPMSRHVE